MPRLLTLTTDFGEADPFVGVMKGVILGIAPRVVIVDLTHQIEPQNIEQAARVLRYARPFFPRGTIHVAVVDPGVGTCRRPLLVQTGRDILIGPDNGVLMENLPASSKVYELNRSRYFLKKVSSTFQGRDLFAPAAAWVARGTAPSRMGRRIDDPVRLALAQPRITGHTIEGEIIHADRFGNLATNISETDCPAWPPPGGVLRAGRRRITRLVSTYAEAPAGQPACLINSWGLLEIFLRGDSARKVFKLQPGHPVKLAWT